MSDKPSKTWLENSIPTLPGISDKRQKLFAKLGVDTLEDLLWLVPRTYENWQDRTPLSELQAGMVATFVASVDNMPSSSRRGRLTYLRARLADQGASIQAVWFNQPWIAGQLTRGSQFLFRGKVEESGRRISVVNPDFRSLDDDAFQPEFLPVYPLTAGLYQTTVRKAVKAALDHPSSFIEETLPQSIRSEAKLTTADFAVRRIHYPTTLRDLELARKRLAFEELFLVMAGLRALRSGRRGQRGPVMTIRRDTRDWISRQLDALPFKLTPSQESALEAIFDDFRKDEPANRLIQGDVGSGKTVVAAMAMAAACKEGYQAVMMAPTTILAGQHMETVSKILEETGLEIALLTGATRAAEKRKLIGKLQEGAIDILIGTHAVLEEDVIFANLGCCVTDEQHRFGVRQRVSLTGSGDRIPHVLVMSATPIPRTLAMILYGDLDISEIRDMPEGRLPVKTYTATSRDRARIDRMIAGQIEAGSKTYVVCPLVEDSESVSLNSAQAVFERLSQEAFPDSSVALMHGRLKARDKQAVMDAFSRGEIDILVSTTVIEVGIDQPDATLLVVENAERFGLSQLHQLRGRVGRSSRQSYCVLVSDSEDAKVRERLRVLCRNQSGFAIADKDLVLRGPGDMFGVQQHGLPDFKVANLYEDSELLREVAGACDRLFALDPGLEMPENQVIMKAFHARYGERLSRPGL